MYIVYISFNKMVVRICHMHAYVYQKLHWIDILPVYKENIIKLITVNKIINWIKELTIIEKRINFMLVELLFLLKRKKKLFYL